MNFKIIPQAVLDNGFRYCVHVEGWKSGCKFQYLKTENGVHHLITPNTGRRYKTSNNLCYLRRHERLADSYLQETFRRELTNNKPS